MSGRPGQSDRNEALVRAGRSLGNASAMLGHAVAERLGLHPTDWECVTHLVDAEEGSMTAGQLAQLTGLTTGAITGVVDRLEAAGYARRDRDPDDRRRVIVRLVPERFAAVAPLFMPMLADFTSLHAGYTDEQLALIREVLSGAAQIMRRHALRIRSGDADETATSAPRAEGA
jgi:DNA-binding MarR family transcriptional regulator